ncbi:hypothetical protein MB901379_02680 [Mycobacterium basiliense]|uniref:PknH-like extracellular domain-containing protein n=1 Tax=Mycobacterium basiliense TaxID=2094119 RepID=A0A447GF75_9MYCO|nr:hypothetical protein [Mycobacterium basiliense]VDM89113.1 hypothetical protein MB901379_02680 [Mycobacterium basiliense]
MESVAAQPSVRGQPWPYLVGAIALAVLAACGLVLLVTAPPSNSGSMNLATRSNWALATTLPASADFPADWGYSLTGRLQRASPADSAMLSAPPNAGPAPHYEPVACGSIPRILDHSGDALAAYVQVDRYAQLFVQDAPAAYFAATGEGREHGPNARFAIWVVPDASTRITNYVDWLSHCSSYQVTNYFLDGQAKNRRSVTAQVEERFATGADAAVAVSRTFTTASSRDPALTYHVMYYAVRGVLLECTIYLEGSDLNLVHTLATQTMHRLRAL